MRDAFRMADEVLYNAVRGISDLITVHGLINLDFADVRTIMNEMGVALMGTGVAPRREPRASRRPDWPSRARCSRTSRSTAPTAC